MILGFQRRSLLGSSLVLLLSLCLSILGLSVEACQICLPLPTESLADRILASEHVVLARENPDRPYTLRAIRSLKESASPPPQVDLFLDSATRRRLSLDANLSVLCGWFPEQGEWRRLLLYEKSVAPVVDEIISQSSAWREHPERRVQYFADFLTHEHTALSDLAHIEVARAPYAQLKQYADRIPGELLHEKLGNPRRVEWHSLYILFLAQSEDPRDQEFIRQEMADTARFGLSIQTAAWATALIEIDGRDGIQKLSELYLGDADRRPEEITAIHAAFRVHGNNGSVKLRDRVVAAYGKLLKKQPGLAPVLADDLTRWERFDHAAAFATLLATTSPDFASFVTIRNHLRSAFSTMASTAASEN